MPHVKNGVVGSSATPAPIPLEIRPSYGLTWHLMGAGRMGLGSNPKGAFWTVSVHLSDTIRVCLILPKPWSHTGETKEKRKLTDALGSVQIGLKIRCPKGRVGSSPSSGTLENKGFAPQHKRPPDRFGWPVLCDLLRKTAKMTLYVVACLARLATGVAFSCSSQSMAAVRSALRPT